MPQARDEAGNIWEVDAQGNPVRLIEQAPIQTKPADQKLPAELQKLGNQAQASQYDPQLAATDLDIKRQQLEINRSKEARDQQIFEKTGGLGADAQAAEKKYQERVAKSEFILGTVANMENLYNQDIKGRPAERLFGASEYIDGLPANERFKTAGQTLLGLVRPMIASSAREGDSDREMAAFEAYLPTNDDTDETIEYKFKALKALVGGIVQGKSASETQAMLQTGVNPEKLSTPALIEERQQLAEPGKDFKSVDDPKLAGVNQRIAEMLRAGIPDDQIRGYAKSAGLDIANTTLEKALDFRRANPKYTGGYSVNVDDIEVPVSGIDQARNSIAQSGPGTAFATAANAVSFGVPEALAPDQYRAIRDKNPGSAFLGDVAGVIGGTGAVGAIGRAAAKRAAPNLLRSGGRAQFGRNVAADATYGGLYGGVSEGDPVTGALSAAGGSVVGAGIGKVAARPVAAAFNSGPVSNSVNRARSIIGKRSVPKVPKLSTEEAAILSAIGGDKAAIAEKLTQAGNLDIPMTLADSSEGLTSLAGAAVRRSPDARSLGRNVFEPRQAGQVDRLLGGIESDIGPISNIPQLSDDLIAKARAESRPLYESALSRSGASSVDLSRFADRPAFKQAMRKAYETARNRGETGDTLGIDLNQAGEPFLTRTPDFRTLDNIKKGLDDVVEGYKDPTTGRYNFDGNGYAVNETLRDFIGEVDRINPDYAAARKAYAGPATQRSSLAAGGDAYTQTPDELARSFENSPAQEQFKLGYTGAIAKDVNNVNYSSNPYQRVLGSPAKQQKLASLFPEGAPNMVQRFNLEMDMARANNAILGGSPTALNQNADAAFSNPFLNAATDIGTDLALGAPLKSPSLINRAIGPIKDARKIGFGKQKAERIAPILFDDNAAKHLKELSGKGRKRSMLGKKANQKAYDAARAAAFGATYPIIIDAQR